MTLIYFELLFIDDFLFLSEKHWNSSCLRPEECKTGYCDTENSLCSCPTYSEIDVENEECTAKPGDNKSIYKFVFWVFFFFSDLV